jgi:hypothetical protein
VDGRQRRTDLDREHPRHRAGRGARLRLPVHARGAAHTGAKAPVPMFLRIGEVSRDDLGQEAITPVIPSVSEGSAVPIPLQIPRCRSG